MSERPGSRHLVIDLGGFVQVGIVLWIFLSLLTVFFAVVDRVMRYYK